MSVSSQADYWPVGEALQLQASTFRGQRRPPVELTLISMLPGPLCPLEGERGLTPLNSLTFPHSHWKLTAAIGNQIPEVGAV